jgi:UvrD/REP helicase N-terminal domain
VGKRIVDDNKVPELWQNFLLETGDSAWDAEFLAAEWTQVILGQVLGSRADYFSARRPGLGRTLSRAERDQIWQLTERFTKWLDDQGRWTWRQVAERAARLEMDRAARSEGLPPEDSGGFLRHRYRHIVVDEAQDLSAAHWKMLRAMVASGPDDLFLAGDTTSGSTTTT